MVGRIIRPMGNSRFETDCRVAREDYLSSLKIPTFKDSGMSHIGYHELLRDPAQNRQALEKIIENYLMSFAMNDSLDLLLGPDPDAKKGSNFPGAEWRDRTIVEELIYGSKKLLEGEYTPYNLRSASCLISAYYDVCQRGIDEALRNIEDSSVDAKKIRNSIRRLNVESKEPETLEEISDKIREVEGCLTIVDFNHFRLLEDIGNLKLCLQASRFTTTLCK